MVIEMSFFDLFFECVCVCVVGGNGVFLLFHVNLTVCLLRLKAACRQGCIRPGTPLPVAVIVRVS